MHLTRAPNELKGSQKQQHTGGSTGPRPLCKCQCSRQLPTLVPPYRPHSPNAGSVSKGEKRQMEFSKGYRHRESPMIPSLFMETLSIGETGTGGNCNRFHSLAVPWAFTQTNAKFYLATNPTNRGVLRACPGRHSTRMNRVIAKGSTPPSAREFFSSGFFAG